MIPEVVHTLVCDLNCYGNCFYIIKDKPNKFSIKRIDPLELKGQTFTNAIIREYV